MNVSYHMAEEEDLETVLDLTIRAGDGMYEAMLGGVVPGISARRLLRLALKAEESPLSLGNTLVARDEEGRTVGIALCYPDSERVLPPILSTLARGTHWTPFLPLLAPGREGGWYLHALAIAEGAQGQGLGRALVKLAAEVGAARDHTHMTLHAWADNAVAQTLYGGLGFEVVERLSVTLGAKGDARIMLAMEAPLPLSP
jgi:ribosomal protein S18 acetylase RimI-like enzyme